MKFIDIIYEKADGIAWLTINRPEVYNAIRGRTTDEMGVALKDAGNDDSVRVVVISGSGPNAFCSGRDQGEDRTSPEYSGTDEGLFMDLVKHIPKPIIAMVDGYAIGSGNILAYTCDFTVAFQQEHLWADGAEGGKSRIRSRSRLSGARGRAEACSRDMDVDAAVLGPAGSRDGSGQLRRAARTAA